MNKNCTKDGITKPYCRFARSGQIAPQRRRKQDVMFLITRVTENIVVGGF